MSTTRGSQHLDDGALARILDRQPPYDDRPASLDDDAHDATHDATHLAGCADCRARYDVIERRSRAFHGLLEDARPAEPAPPADLLERARRTAGARAAAERRRWLGAPLLRTAAVVAVVVAGALTAEPVRDWLGDAARQLMTALEPGAPPDPEGPSTPADDAVEVTIVPTGARLVLRFDAAEPGAIARIVFRGGSGASGQVLGDPSTPDLVALPDGFRVRNAGARGTRYHFTAPAGMPVEVRVADRVLATLAGEAGDEREVALEH